MYAIIENGSHQYRTWPGEFIKIEQVKIEVGGEWKSDQVLAFRNESGSLVIGSPYVEKAEIRGRVVRHGKTKKVLVFKKNRRKAYRKTKGHRQTFTEIYIESFFSPSGEKIQDKKQNKKQEK